MSRIGNWWNRQSRKMKFCLAVAATVFVLFLCNMLGHAVQWVEKKVGPSPQEVLGVSNIGYNFTPYHVDYQLGEHTGGSLPEGVANGGSIVCCYKQKYPNQPMIVRWRYYGKPYKDDGKTKWFYEALLNIPLPENNRISYLTLRFYPGGRVAVRYTSHPETSDFGNVSPELSGSGWVQAQGEPLPALLEEEYRLRESGHEKDLDIRPAPPIPIASAASRDNP